MDSLNSYFLKTRYLLFLVFTLFFLEKNYAQGDYYNTQKPDTRYYSMRLGKWVSDGRTLHLSPEVYGFDYLKFGLSVGEMKWQNGEGGGIANVMQAGIEFLPTKGIVAPKISVWKGGWVFGIGGKYGINGLYYFRKDASSFGFRPMIGIGILYFHFNYGYTFFANKNFNDLNPHSFSLSWHHSILPRGK